MKVPWQYTFNFTIVQYIQIPSKSPHHFLCTYRGKSTTHSRHNNHYLPLSQVLQTYISNLLTINCTGISKVQYTLVLFNLSTHEVLELGILSAEIKQKCMIYSNPKNIYIFHHFAKPTKIYMLNSYLNMYYLVDQVSVSNWDESQIKMESFFPQTICSCQHWITGTYFFLFFDIGNWAKI